jgi:hypothetical protein
VRFDKIRVNEPATFASIVRTGARVLRRKNYGPIVWRSGPIPGKSVAIAASCMEIFVIDGATFATFGVIDGTRDETKKWRDEFAGPPFRRREHPKDQRD